MGVFVGGAIRKVVVDVPGDPRVDLEKEVAATFAREVPELVKGAGEAYEGITVEAFEQRGPLAVPMPHDPAFHDRDNFAGAFAGKHEVQAAGEPREVMPANGRGSARSWPRPSPGSASHPLAVACRAGTERLGTGRDSGRGVPDRGPGQRTHQRVHLGHHAPRVGGRVDRVIPAQVRM